MITHNFLLSVFLFYSLLLTAQDGAVFTEETIDTENPATFWQELDPNTDGLYGVASRTAVASVPKGRKPQTVVVAVIDGGLDINHPDLQGHIWTNEGEIPGNGIDDDGNGYTDDVHGWNFLGSPDGRSIDYETLEVTRLYRDLKRKFKGVKKSDVPAEQRHEYKLYLRVKEDFDKRVEHANQDKEYIDQLSMIWKFGIGQFGDLLPQNFGSSELRALDTGDKDLNELAALMAELMDIGINEATLDEMLKDSEAEFKYHLNTLYDPRSMVGDDPDDPNEKYYGNPFVGSDSSGHGTHVSGLIAAVNNNNLGINGIGGDVVIMALRAVPDGDERDKDIANAITYAVENGAKIINCSFGKEWSPHKEVVDRAVRLAEKEGVLIIHAAGNDAIDLDKQPEYPNRNFTNGGPAARNWLEIGASASQQDMNWASDFSNYGDRSVDLFAPGVELLSTIPGNKYEVMSGTSMASPVVAGVAALVLSYYPELTASQLRDIIVASSLKFKKQKVYLPNEEGKKKKTRFGKLCISGGLVNAHQAIILAEQLTDSNVELGE